jgi:hypothetical protein
VNRLEILRTVAAVCTVFEGLDPEVSQLGRPHPIVLGFMLSGALSDRKVL